MIQDIKKQIELIENSISWASKFDKDTFPKEDLKEYRRQIKRILAALEGKCSAAAYGESQVGKSYLISSLLSTPESPFVITHNGKEYSFIDEINTSGGDTTMSESTGVITRFTIDNDNEAMKDYVKIKNLSVADIIMLLVDSYYNDVKIDTDTILRYDEINEEIREKLSPLWVNKKTPQQDYLQEDDVKDICDYIKDVIGSNAAGITQSDFSQLISPNIQYVESKDWVSIFSLLWNKNEHLSRLFVTLIDEFAKLKFQQDVYVPFNAVLRKQGTLLKIQWLDDICNDNITNVEENEDVKITDVYSANGDLLAKDYPKASLSALIAELTFVVPRQLARERKFLEKIDLLDFPGARTREKFEEKKLGKVLPTILRRGKVAYLFNKYSRSLKIGSVLFSHHNDQKSGPYVGETINEWIETNIGKTPEERTESLKRTNGVSPLFFVATKFNKELEKNKSDVPEDKTSLSRHWDRFKIIFPEIIKPATWYDSWTLKRGTPITEPFRHIYPLRDFYWSSRNNVFDGYNDSHEVKSPETNVHEFIDYPNYFEELRLSFINDDMVREHFVSPIETWKEVATPNNDGSKAIIRDLSKISEVLEEARNDKYLEELKEIKKRILSLLMVHYESDDKEENIKRAGEIVGEIRLSLDTNIGKRPEIFGRIIDGMMISVSAIRQIAYDIVVLRRKTPKDVNEIMFIRQRVRINPDDDRQANVEKLCKYYNRKEEDLGAYFEKKGFTLDDVVSKDINIAATVAQVVTDSVLEYWSAFINNQVKTIEEYIPHSDEIAFMLQVLCKELGVKEIIANKINTYSHVFNNDDLPNVIADFAALTLNNFVSTVGRERMSVEIVKDIKEKAEICKIELEISTNLADVRNTPIDVEEALMAFDSADDPTTVSLEALMKLPFWDNYQKWNDSLIMGILYCSDISHCNPEANKELKKLIDSCATLYSA